MYRRLEVCVEAQVRPYCFSQHIAGTIEESSGRVCGVAIAKPSDEKKFFFWGGGAYRAKTGTVICVFLYFIRFSLLYFLLLNKLYFVAAHISSVLYNYTLL